MRLVLLPYACFSLVVQYELLNIDKLLVYVNLIVACRCYNIVLLYTYINKVVCN